MAKTLPPLTWFRSFEAAARTLSFTAAAHEIGMTQSAVSQQVKALEHRLGVLLFHRQARGLALTDEGRRLLPQVGTALDMLTAAAGAFDVGPSQKLLTVAASVSVTQWVITPHLAGFTALYPDIRIRFVSAVWPDDFARSLADVEIRFGSYKQVGAGARALVPNHLVALKSPSLSGDLETLPRIEAVGTSDGWKAFHLLAEIPETRSTLFADSYGQALALAVHGNGVCLVSAFLAGYALTSGLVETAHPVTIPANEGYFLSVADQNPSAHLFADWLQGLAAPTWQN